MNTRKNKCIAALVTSFVIFIICCFFILPAFIPDNILVSYKDVNGGWIPDTWQWVITSKYSDSTPAMENPAKKVSENNKDIKRTETVYFCGIIPVKTINVSITEETTVVPGGDCIGIKLKTEGLLVAGTESFESINSAKVCPGKDAGIKPGDTITSINGISVSTIADIRNILQTSPSPIICEGKRNNTVISWTVKPEKSKESGNNKLGLWLRESIAGIGTLTFYYDGKFAALGHPITDTDTGEHVDSSGGSICAAGIIGINKGQKDIPGALKGIFTGDDIGKISSNSPNGVFGTMDSPQNASPLHLAGRKEIHPGKAEIICDTGDGKKYYKCEILKVFPGSRDTKSMTIHITDEELIEKTGGIVQGMSGSPIIQNGRIVGAVTHVFVNDPTRGYGIFIENMLAEAEKIE